MVLQNDYISCDNSRISHVIVTKFPEEKLSVTQLRKHAYSNILRILPPKNEKNFQMKSSCSFHISVQNIDCGYSLEPPRRDIRKLMFAPVNPSFTIQKWGLRGSKLYMDPLKTITVTCTYESQRQKTYLPTKTLMTFGCADHHEKCLIISTPLKPQFYIVKLGFTGV